MKNTMKKLLEKEVEIGNYVITVDQILWAAGLGVALWAGLLLGLIKLA
jgi:hypothetical protein